MRREDRVVLMGMYPHGTFNSLEALREAEAKRVADNKSAMHKVAHSFEPMDPRVEEDGVSRCPWCGGDLHCTLVEYDDALGEHVQSCAVWLEEQPK